MFDVPPPPTVPQDAPAAYVYQLEQPQELTRECVLQISRHYQVHPIILSLIGTVEGGWSGAKIKNTDGTHDLGFAQINTIHGPTMARYGLTEAMMQNNNCINLGFAAWYVRTVTKNQTATDTEGFFRAIARYHNKQEPHISVYTKKLREAYSILIKNYNSGDQM